jgi:Lon protease-like protein
MSPIQNQGSAMSDYLSIFSLDVVLFPEMLLPLHIFEEHYKEMIGECLQSNSPFGVLYAHDNRLETVGCTAEISQVIKKYPDGRIDLIAVGQKRFQVSFFDSEKSYLRASIELLPDSIGDKGLSEEQAQQALDLFAQVCKLIGQDEPEEFHDASAVHGLAFRMASSLHLQNEIRQRILEIRSENQRLERLTEHLSELIPRLTARQKSAKQAGSNGRLH